MKTTIANPVNTTNAMGKKRKRPKNIHKSKKDEENILSKDIEDDNIRYMMDTKKNLKPREDLKSSFTLKNLRFKPQKYKGSFLPYHLRWIFNNNVKSNEIVLLNEIEGLENEIYRLKSLKLINRECRKLAGLPFGITTNFCQCCHLFEKKKHDCSHKFCNDSCPRKKADELMNNLLKNKFKENKENPYKEKTGKKLYNDINNKIESKNEDNDNVSSTPNNNFIRNDSNKSNKIELNKNMNNNCLNETINDKNKTKVNSIKKRLIFGTVERTNKERRNIFLVKSDLNITGNNNNSIGILRNDSSNYLKVNEIKSDSNESQENDLNKEDFDVNNYTVSIESEGDAEIEEIININNENDEVNENEEKNESKIDKKNSDKENEEDDVIIINQTSPQNSDNE
jgi:hypothetical protein